MSCDEFKELCRMCWEEDFNYLYIDISKKIYEGNFCIFNESKNFYIEYAPETIPFYFIQTFQMLYSLKNRDHLESLNDLASLQNQVKALSLHDKLGKQHFQEDMKKVFEHVFETNKDASEEVTKTLMVTSEESSKAVSDVDEKFLNIMNDRCILAPYLLSSLSKITNPKHTSQFKLVDLQSNRVNDLLINKTIPVTFYGNSLNFRDTEETFKMEVDLSKMITNEDYSVRLAKPQDRKLMFKFAKEMNLWWKGRRYYKFYG